MALDHEKMMYGMWLKRYHLKIFLFLALVAILFSGTV